MPTTEHTINDALSEALADTRHAWKGIGVLSSENTGMLSGTNDRPDILVIEPNVSPVVIETEVVPAATVENDASVRLGHTLRRNGRPILSAIAVRIPVRMRNKARGALRQEIAHAKDLEFALYTGNGAAAPVRWPVAGWLSGGLADLSLLVQSATIPPDVIEKAVDDLVTGVSSAAGLMEDIAKSSPGAMDNICQELKQHESDQTRRMACTILANAFVFEESVSGGPGKLKQVQSLGALRKQGLSKQAILDEWGKILAVNYWPIFDIARRILQVVPTHQAKDLVESLSMTAENLLASHLMHSHDLTGAVFQRLIADRKFLAAYYTTPAAAALLVGLTVSDKQTPANGLWSKRNDIESLRIADFACGTGTLLSTAYQHVGQLHELAGGNTEAIHPEMMARAIIGCDVLPAAAHLTASMLSGAHPTTKYSDSSILTVAYGKQPDGSIALGSLDLLHPQAGLSGLGITAKSAGGMGAKDEDTWKSLPHKTFHLVLMNPPFTRATGQEASKIGVPNPMFAAFASDKEEQRLMGAATKRLMEGTSAHGNAGEASMFLVLGDKMLKDRGTLGLVMPLSLLAGEAWEKSRQLLAEHYENLVLVSITGAGGGEISFSADTGMGETLVAGTKKASLPGIPLKRTQRATFVVLKERPPFPMMGAQAARQIRDAATSNTLRHLEDGPVGGTPLTFGADTIGYAIDAPVPTIGPWPIARIADLSLAQAAYQIIHHQHLWLPGMTQAVPGKFPTTTVGKLGKIGPYHSDVDGMNADGSVRGPFKHQSVKPGSVPTYPILWEHDAPRERCMRFDADSEGTHRQGKNAADTQRIAALVANVVASASYCHFNRDFRFNSQSTAMQYTDRLTIGGRAWMSIKLASPIQEKALVLWGNTTPGLLLHWSYSNRQQAGRGSIGKLALAQMPVLDIGTFNPVQLRAVDKVFRQLSGSPLKPVNEIATDTVRATLDELFFVQILGLPKSIAALGGALDLLRQKLAAEPSVAGGK